MFDSYHKWLGIPPGPRPPTHYQLLGLSPDERDREVIDGAATRQAAYVRNFQVGPHAADCARILGEIAQARRTLLEAPRRSLYDEGLRLEEANRVKARRKPRRKSAGAFRRVLTHLVIIALGMGAIVAILKARRDGTWPPGRTVRAPVPETKEIHEVPATGPVVKAPPLPVVKQNVEEIAARREKFIKLGIASESANDVHSAIAWYSWAIRTDPTSATAYNRRAWQFVLWGMYSPANADYDVAVEIEPKNPWHYTGRGISYFRTNNIQGAIDNYNEAIKVDPGYAGAYFHRSWAYRKQGKADLADADRRKALEIDPGQAAHDVMYR